MNPARIKSFSVGIFHTPLKRPFITSLGQKTKTTNVGITINLEGGVSGYGEASTSLALAHLTPASLSKALRCLASRALGEEAAFAQTLILAAWQSHGNIAPAASAFECALLEAAIGASGLALASWFGGNLKTIDSDITLSAWDNDMTRSAAREAWGQGFRTFKIKVGKEFKADISRVRAAHGAAPKARLLLDGNQGMTVSSAMRLVEACLKEKLPIGLLEQPLEKSEFKKMALLTRRCPIPVAADEMVSTPQEALRAALEGAASVINIKVAKSGLLRSLQIAAVARAAGLGLMIGCMAETARGLKPSVHLALGTGFFDYVDLDSDHLLAGPQAPAGWLRRGSALCLDR